MYIREFIGYKLICCISPEYEGEPDYSEYEFEVVFSEDSSSDDGCSVTINGDYDDVERIGKNLFFGTWDIKRKERI